jgi:hypothetical protein
MNFRRSYFGCKNLDVTSVMMVALIVGTDTFMFFFFQIYKIGNLRESQVLIR